VRTRRELLLAALMAPKLVQAAAPDAQDLAHRLAERYPVNAPLGYASAVIWSAQRQLGGALATARRHGWLAAGIANTAITRAWLHGTTLAPHWQRAMSVR
jgi:hypothetical protein